MRRARYRAPHWLLRPGGPAWASGAISPKVSQFVTELLIGCGKFVTELPIGSCDQAAWTWHQALSLRKWASLLLSSLLVDATRRPGLGIRRYLSEGEQVSLLLSFSLVVESLLLSSPLVAATRRPGLGIRCYLPEGELVCYWASHWLRKVWYRAPHWLRKANRTSIMVSGFRDFMEKARRRSWTELRTWWMMRALKKFEKHFQNVSLNCLNRYI